MISLGAIPIYLLAKLKLKSDKIAITFSIIYLLNPVLHGINWYDFHPEAFIIAPFLFAIYFSELEKWREYTVSIILTLFAIDKAAIIVASFGLFKILKISLKKFKTNERKHLTIFFFTFFLSILWFILTSNLISIFNPQNLYASGTSQYWNDLGARNLIDMPSKIIENPILAVDTLIADANQKVIYILSLFSPLLFLPFLEPSTIILFVPWLGTSLLSSYPPYYQIGTQYPAFILPLIFYSAILGGQKALNFATQKKTCVKLKKNFYKILYLSTTISLIASSPLTFWAVGNYPYNTYGLPIIPDQADTVNKFIELVPKNASILVQNNIFPLVSNRKTAFVTPASVFYPAKTSFKSVLNEMLKKMDYILLDINTAKIDSSIILSNQITHDEFGLLGCADGVVLLKRNYDDKPVIYEKVVKQYNYKNLIKSDGATLKPDSESKSKIILSISKETEDFWYGPYAYLPPGLYAAKYRIKLNEEVQGEVMTLVISSFSSEIYGKIWGNNQTGYHLIFSINENGSKIEHNSTKIIASGFPVNEYVDVILEFQVDSLAPFEFIGKNIKTEKEIYLDQILIEQIEPGFKYNSTIAFIN